jgi:hypothetical protein
MFEKIYRVLVLILLVVLVLGISVVGYFAYTEYRQKVARVETCNQSVAAADFVSFMADYKKDVYNNPQVDNINKQILMANEYQVMAIAKQTMIIADCQP